MEKILLVEDEYELAQAVAQELVASGYHVVRATNGESALRMHAEQKPDVVILDWMLPRLNGLEVLRRLRQNAATPVLMLTARGEEADRVLGLELGADDYLVKPFSMRELIARVRALLRRSELLHQIVANDQTGTQQPLCYGPIYLDAQQHRASIDEQPVELSPHEFTLLSLLMRNPGRTFHRSYLLDTIWGNDYEGSGRTVDTAVVRLRKKLGQMGEAIETVWGIGYRLKSERKFS